MIVPRTDAQLQSLDPEPNATSLLRYSEKALELVLYRWKSTSPHSDYGDYNSNSCMSPKSKRGEASVHHPPRSLDKPLW
jgi:hypothetical protein